MATKKVNKSAEKRERQSLVRRAKNKSAHTALRTQMKKVRTAAENKEVDKAKAEYVKVQSMLGKAAVKGRVHKKKASRLMSRLAKKVAKASQK